MCSEYLAIKIYASSNISVSIFRRVIALFRKHMELFLNSIDDK